MLNGHHVQQGIIIAPRVGGYPSLAFQCVTDFNCRILAVYGPQFGRRNDKEIVKDDPNVHYVQTGWYKDVLWRYYTADGRVEED